MWADGLAQASDGWLGRVILTYALLVVGQYLALHLLALADAVREAGRPRLAPRAVAAAGAVGARSGAEPNGTVETGRRGHLRILRDR